MIGRITLTLVIVLATAGQLGAQPPAGPAFTLTTSQVFNSKERPAITLIHREVDHLDFRVYRVNDAFAFFAKLRDPHQLGSDAPLVPQERTWIERIALWKAARRSDARAFVRRQFTTEYRRARRNQSDADQVVRRRTVNVNNFAQVPVLNAAQLVTSWREILPPVRDPEYRRLPLEISSTGLYVVEAVNGLLRAYTIVGISDVGLVTKTAPGQMLVFAADRFSGAPLANCRVRVLADQKPVADGTTSADGTFKADITAANKEDDNLITLAECGGQVAATDPGAYLVHQEPRRLVGYIYTDRPIYRPGHTVQFKGVLRWKERETILPIGRDPVEVTVTDDGGKVLLRERKTVDEFGALSGSFTVPTTASLGYYSVKVARGEAAATGFFEVQEYRKPEFDVAVRAPLRVELQGTRVTATIAARYYFGQPVSGGVVTYAVHKQGYYSPLRYADSVDEEDVDDYGYYGGAQVLEGTARLNDQGTANITIPLEVDERGRDYSAHIEARVTDASGREVSGATSVAATFGRFLLIARPDRYVYQPGGTAIVALRALDYVGKPQSGLAMHVALERVDYGSTNARYTPIQQSDVQGDADGRASASIAIPRAAGSYRVRVSADSEGRRVTTTSYLWVPGRMEGEFDGDRFLELVADQRSYQPGQTARLIIRGEEFETSVLVTKETNHISFHQVVKARGNEAIDVPIGPEDVGDTYVSIAFIKDDRLFRAERRLSVPATAHQLTVTAMADKPVIRPGEPGLFTLHVADAAGAPVRAQLSVGLVDEALYGVKPDTTPDPLRFFYRREYSMVGTSFSREYSFVGHSGTEPLLLARRRSPMTLADFKADRPDRPRVRKDFPDTAFWAANVTTGADGTAQVRVDYPDSLTSWRLTVRAVTTETSVGTTTTNTTTTKDLILRVVPPRFLTEGDEASIPAVVHNYLPDTKSVNVAFTAEGLSARDGAPPPALPRTVVVPANGQQRVDLAVKADRVGRVTVGGKATTDDAGDAMEISLPVLPAGLQRNAGMSGSIVGKAERTLALTVPPSSNASGRSVRLSLAPSLAGAMFGALDYLTSYPWGCTEQTLSSFVPNLVVLRTLGQLQLAPTERLLALDRQVSDGLKRLYDYQHTGGGWGWWKTDEDHPFMTAYAIDGLLQAQANGVQVETWRIRSGFQALQKLYTEYARALPDLKAYELYVLNRDNRAAEDGAPPFDVAAALDDLWSARGRMTASGRAYLLMILDQRKDPRASDAARELLDKVQTRGDVSWWQVDSDPLLEDFGDTSAEGSALALKALAAHEPGSPVLERVARWLVLARNAGSFWVSTKQTALALQGLLAFMESRGEKPAPISADIYVNGTRVARQAFDAASLTNPNPVLIEVPATAGTNNVRIVTEGAGTVYYDAGVRYYDPPAAAELTGSHKLALLRTYSRLTPVTQKGRIVYVESPFYGLAEPGDLLLVSLTVAGSTDLRYLMLEDPIPAGTEPVDHEERYTLQKDRMWWYGSQRELRDDRVVYFINRFWTGRSEFAYLLRVTTPGTFNAMPARISSMYVPDISASSPVLTVTVPMPAEPSR